MTEKMNIIIPEKALNEKHSLSFYPSLLHIKYICIRAEKQEEEEDNEQIGAPLRKSEKTNPVHKAVKSRLEPVTSSICMELMSTHVNKGKLQKITDIPLSRKYD